MTYGERMKAYRLARKLTQEEVAEQTGLTLTAISKIEGGTRKVELGEAVRLAEVFRVSLAQLAGMATEPLPAERHVAASHCLKESQQLAHALTANLQNLEALVAS